jgi:hypothetical protein
MTQRPLDVAVVLGPSQAVARARAAGVRVANSWSPPLGLNGLAQRPLRRIVDDLAAEGGAFAGAVVWTPGAMAAAIGINLPITDMTTGSTWADAKHCCAVGAEASRQAWCEEIEISVDQAVLIGAVADPPGQCDAMLAMYGVALAGGAGIFERMGRRGVLVVPLGARGIDRAAAFASGIGQDLVLHTTERTVGSSLSGLDIAMIMPTQADAPSHIVNARAWWLAAAKASGTRSIVADGEEGATSVLAWGRADLGRALGRLLSSMPAGVPR